MTAARSRRLGGVRPVQIGTAREGIAREHRHLGGVRVPRSGLAAWEAVSAIGWPVGWLLVGRPSSRVLAARGWLEVTRCATTGRCWGAASALYRAAAEWARTQGRPLITYTLASESGASLIAAGWLPEGWTRGGGNGGAFPGRALPCARASWRRRSAGGSLRDPLLLRLRRPLRVGLDGPARRVDEEGDDLPCGCST